MFCLLAFSLPLPSCFAEGSLYPRENSMPYLKIPREYELYGDSFCYPSSSVVSQFGKVNSRNPGRFPVGIRHQNGILNSTKNAFVMLK